MSIQQEVIEKLTQALRSGNDIETASHFAGTSVTNVYRWLEIGKFEAEKLAIGEKPEPANSSYLEFWEELRKARADAIVRNVAYIQTAAKNGSWQAAAWWLERSVPENYAKTAGTKSPGLNGNSQIAGE
jgi:hypothetical protein